LIDCPSSQADALRARIAEEEAAGRGRDEVVADIYAEFGEIIWQAPRAEGFGIAAYLIPLAAGLAGIAIVATFLRRQRSAAARDLATPNRPGAATGPRIDPDLERRIDAEMNELGL
jgi:cytochrome c-type biogenesis protein CcmH/NrfF